MRVVGYNKMVAEYSRSKQKVVGYNKMVAEYMCKDAV